MKKKEFPKWLVCGLAAFFVLALWMYRDGNIGLSERGMLKNYITYGQDGHSFVKDIGDNMAVFLSWNQDQTEMDVDIYVKRKGSIGWFFRYGGATSSVSGPIKFVSRMGLEGNREYALIYVSPEAIDRIEVVMGDDSRKTLYPEAGKPFAYILERGWEVTLYGADGQVIIPEERML